jgi:hypothetical protein
MDQRHGFGRLVGDRQAKHHCAFSRYAELPPDRDIALKLIGYLSRTALNPERLFGNQEKDIQLVFAPIGPLEVGGAGGADLMGGGNTSATGSVLAVVSVGGCLLIVTLS